MGYKWMLSLFDNMSGKQTRRRYLQGIGSLGTVVIAGCAGDESDDTTTATEVPTGNGTTTVQEGPDFRVSIEAPDTVTNLESWGFTITIVNEGGPGEFTSPISHRINDGEWSVVDTIDTDRLENQEGIEVEYGERTSPAPLDYHIRVDDADVSTTVQVTWADKYRPSNIRDNATSPPYDEFFRSFESYEGEQIHFLYGDIYQTLFNQGDSPPQYDHYQLDVTNNEDEYEGDIAAWWYGDERLLEGDLIELWGVAERLYEYETVQGDVRTIPIITLVDYDLRNDE